MTISDQSKIRERTATISQPGASLEQSLSMASLKKSGFQSMLMQTIEKSQSSIAQQNRARNSEARYSSAAQPKMSAHQAESSRSSAATVAASREFHQANQATGATQPQTSLKQGGYQGANLSGAQYFAPRLNVQNRLIDAAGVMIAEPTSGESASEVSVNRLLREQIDNNAEFSDAKQGFEHSSQDVCLNKEAIARAKLQDSDVTGAQDDRAASEGGGLSAPEQSNTKLMSVLLDQPREAPKSALNVAIQSYVGTEQWGREVRQKIVWMFGVGQQSATLTLNPPNLGPLHVSLKMQNNIAHATFSSNDPNVRQALAEGLPLLSEMMAQRGLVLGNTTMTEFNKDILS
jgi:flagellar hook-length control protein FliK